jgi:3-isopropylmalate dehydratase small subunit
MEGRMSSNAKIKGNAHKFGDNINTDVHCSNKYTPGLGVDDVAKIALSKLDENFHGNFKMGDVLVAGANFGINSSREFAVHVLKKIGISAVVAKSYGRQFFRNAINNGLPLIECDTDGIDSADDIEIDLETGKVSVAAKNFEQDTPPLPKEVQAILGAGGLIPFLKEHPDWKLN